MTKTAASEIKQAQKDIEKALKGKLSSEEIEMELNSYVNEYDIDVNLAKTSIIKKHGGSVSDMYDGGEKKVEDICAGQKGITVKGRVLYIGSKEINKDGKPTYIQTGILGDETGSVPFTFWETPSKELSKGDTIQVSNVNVSVFNDRPQLNVNFSSNIKTIEPAEVPPFENKSEKMDIGDLGLDIGSANITGRILNIDELTVNVKGEDKQIYRGTIGDETGNISFTFWEDFGLDKGDVVQIDNCYVSEYRGINQLNLSKHGGGVKKLDNEDIPSVSELEKNKKMTIKELKEKGAVDAIVDGAVVDVKESAGLVFRCTECNRVMQNGTCKIDGKVKNEPDLRIKAVLDDGTGSLTLIANQELTQKVLGYGLDEAVQRAKDSLDPAVVQEELKDELVAKTIRVRGSVTSNEYGTMLLAKELDFLDVDVVTKATDLLEKVK